MNPYVTYILGKKSVTQFCQLLTPKGLQSELIFRFKKIDREMFLLTISQNITLVGVLFLGRGSKIAIFKNGLVFFLYFFY